MGVTARGPARERAGRVSLTRRLAAASLLALLVLVLGGGLVVVTAQQLTTAQQQLTRATEARQATANLLRRFVDQETGLRGYVITGQHTLLSPYLLAEDALPGEVDGVRATLDAIGAPPGLLRDVERAHDEWYAYARDQVAAVEDAADDGTLDRTAATGATMRGKGLFDTVRSRVERIDRWTLVHQRESQRETRRLQNRLIAGTAGGLAALAVLLGLGFLVTVRQVTQPLRRLAGATRAVADGDLSAQLRAEGALEVRELAGDVAAMRDRLLADLDRTRQALGALDQEDRAVRAVRQALLPSPGRVAGVRVTARLDAAEGVLAGDWYDTVQVGAGRLGVVVGDVAGHGPYSAVFALRLKHSLATALRTHASPGAALTAVSADLRDVPGELFATAFVCIVDAGAGTLVHANAGHPPALLLPAGDDAPAGGGVRFEELPPTGPLLSSIVGAEVWGEAEHPFGVGDSLLTYTDGVLESRSADGAEFGLDGLLLAVGRAPRHDPARVIDAVAAAALRHAGNPGRRDDHTLVHVLREGAGGSGTGARAASSPAAAPAGGSPGR
jgi:serine phosphatase RsbU (regulator of sigma subunit)/CHASE3 domain sensor protein